MTRSNCSPVKTALLPLAGAASLLLLSSVVQASVPLTPGGPPVALPGTTAAAEPDLAGTVLHDKLLPFTIGTPTQFKGVLQDRVVRSTKTGTLHFYKFIRQTESGPKGSVTEVAVESFNKAKKLEADWRSDGLGTIAPVTAQRSPGVGSRVTFAFKPQTLVAGRESRFFFVKTSEKDFKINGKTTIRLASGASVTLETAAPH
jgi:hypothetical protein